MTMPHPCFVYSMPALNVRVDRDLWSALQAQKPHFLSDTAYLNLIISQAIDNEITLDGATRPQAGNTNGERSPSNKAVKETANKERARGSSKTKRKVERKPIPDELIQFSEAIALFWDHSTGKKTDLAWNGLLRELGKIQQHMDGGNDAVSQQLQKGAEAGWKSITLSNYLQHGLRRSHAPTQASGIDYAALDAIKTPW